MRWIAWRVAWTARLRAERSSQRRPRQTSFWARVDDLGGMAGAPCRPEEIRIRFFRCCNTPDSARFAMKKWMIAVVVFSLCLFATCAFAQTGSTTPKKGQAPATAQSGAAGSRGAKNRSGALDNERRGHEQHAWTDA